MESKSKYKVRQHARLLGHAPKPRDIMPWWYESAMKDFQEREREQSEAMRRGPLSTNPMVPWGNDKPRRPAVEAAEEQFESFER